MAESFFDELDKLRRDINRLVADIERFAESLSRDVLRSLRAAPPVRPIGVRRGIREPLVDLFETETSYVVIAELPGVPKDKLTVNVTEDTVEIRGEGAELMEGKPILREREPRIFQRIIKLPKKIKPEGAKAKLENGILRVELPKLEVEKRVRISIE